MDTFTVIIVLVVVLAVVVAAMIKSIAIVPRGNVGLVERLGRYHRTLQPGMVLIVPFLDRVRVVPTGEQVLALAPVRPVTSDSRAVSVEPVLHVEVVDPVRATYEIADYVKGLETIAEVALRSEVETMTMAAALQSRSELHRVLSQTCAEAADAWGVKVTRVEITDVRPA